uniref:SRPBCC domain-containing protein n=1 Tax=Spongiibacter tropicus TaxID=454602 RepID=UPI0030085D22
QLLDVAARLLRDEGEAGLSMRRLAQDDQYGVSGEVTVTALEKNQRIAIEWPTPVEWTFTPKGNDTTFVSIVASGFTGTDDEKVAQALDSTEGFNLVISACKALLEHGIDLRLISDKNPDAAVSGT